MGGRVVCPRLRNSLQLPRSKVVRPPSFPGGRLEEDCYWFPQVPNPTRAETGKGNPVPQPAWRSYDYHSMAGTGVNTENKMPRYLQTVLETISHFSIHKEKESLKMIMSRPFPPAWNGQLPQISLAHSVARGSTS